MASARKYSKAVNNKVDAILKNVFAAGRWRLLALLAFLGLTGALLLTVQLPGGDYFTRALQNAGHAAMFALLTVISLPVISNTKITALPLKSPLVALFILSCLGLGALVEFAQSFIGRQPSWRDIVLNMTGVGIGLCALAGLQQRLLLRLRLSAMAAGALLLAVSFTEPALWWYRQLQRDRQFPVIAAFESPWVNRFSQPSYGGQVAVLPAPQAWSQNRSQVARLTLHRHKPWPGLTIAEVYPDWRNHRFLYFEIFSQHPDSLYLSLRIHDKFHNHSHDDRFNRRLEIAPGFNHYSIPLENIRLGPRERDMDMGNIRVLTWFMYRPTSEQVIFLDNVKLL